MILKQVLVASNEIVDGTKGEKRLILATTVAGDEVQVWRPVGDSAEAIEPNTRVLVAIDSKGKGHLIDNAASADLEPAPPGSKREQILEYIEKMSRLYAHGYGAAKNQMHDELEAAQIKDVATTIFIQATRHFNL